jgi:tetratricopeptide (TPR) repeat protein
MGLSARRQGDYALARAHHEHALAVYRRAHWQSGIALTHAWLGYTAELEGDADAAETHHIESLEIARETGDPRAVALALEGLAGVAILRGDYQRCATLLGAATALRASVDAPLPAAERVDVDRATDVARSHLDQSAFDLAFERGAAMTRDAAYHYATTFKPTQ